MQESNGRLRQNLNTQKVRKGMNMEAISRKFEQSQEDERDHRSRALKETETFPDHPEAQDKVIRLLMSEARIPDIDFTPMEPGLRDNVLIHVLFDNKGSDPTGSDAALIKYLPGAFVPLHLHRGYEMVLVLQGEYIENGESHMPGSLIIRAPGTTHSMRSNTGCIILAMRDIPVKQLT
ncbi:cupin domain-containing protein [Halomonas sp. McH1-25]|uniref:cupin domain-containing protein n=1 Tax=unclassified Halomonas TaxID=2609666 RepID=UPI001EF4A22F|nr:MULTISPECIES: cupin domain-containing protein [unclassified Halomonas]MCG7601578.1 cupin domain-containing protein [Halomonas sp. McH1-25]MCP1343151.1 cupin domain-containing protein [Halomonas sp. FL8]MCP1360962.1 cupin domain-containing protein [Halomonas sp. BBD45]MCP1364077.1 cupin domain-containing protein [Halomonas sp. BBD48]